MIDAADERDTRYSDNMEGIVCLNRVRVSYGSETVLKDVDLSLKPNEILGIRGENGAGKSTLLRLIAGVIRPESGKRTVSDSLKDQICYVPQEIALYPTLTGKQNLSFWAEIYGVHGKAKAMRIKYLLKLMNLEDKANKRVETYSGGMKRRLNMAASLVINPSLLLLDEPTVGADARSVGVMMGSVQRMKENGCSVVIISHSDIDLESVCDRIITMSHGEIIEEKVMTSENRKSDKTEE